MHPDTVFTRMDFTDHFDARNSNVFFQHDFEGAARVAFPGTGRFSVLGANADPCGLWEYENSFELTEPLNCTMFLSADQRFELYADDVLHAAGPDLGEPHHWSVAAYRVRLPAGKHVLRVLNWFLPQGSGARAALHPFFFCSSPECPALFNTGNAPWRVRRINGWSFLPDRTDCIISQRACFDIREMLSPTPWQTPEVILPPRPRNSFSYGVFPVAEHRFVPTVLPEQMRRTLLSGIGKVRAVTSEDGRRHVFTGADTTDERVAVWQKLLDGHAPVVVPPHTSYSVLIDWQDYCCGYSLVEAAGGGEEEIRFTWAEALCEAGSGFKKNRGEVIGYRMPEYANGETFRRLVGQKHLCRSFWWRAGRFVLVTISTGSLPVTVSALGIREDRYPLEQEGHVETSHKDLQAVQPMLVRSMQMCSHETFMDCPYYEQLMYTGDTRIECLVYYMMQREAALPVRAAQLFDWSRHVWEGIAAERWNPLSPQGSATFAMIWVLMVRDLLLYRRIRPDILRKLRTGVRGNIEALLEYAGEGGLVENLPGWSFVDWVSSWPAGVPAGGHNRGASSVFQLQMIGALKAAAEIERFPGGSPDLEKRFLAEEERLRAALFRVFWDDNRGLFADDREHRFFSEHAQSLALAFDLPMESDDRGRMISGLLEDRTLFRTTIYYSFYLFEALQHIGMAYRIPDKMDRWFETFRNGAVTTWEMPDPSRSDCHAWGSHPLFHIHSSIAGIRPADFGFRRVRVLPQLGDMEHLAGSFPHPDGMIRYDYRRGTSGLSVEIELPEGVAGVFELGSFTGELAPGKNAFVIA